MAAGAGRIGAGTVTGYRAVPAQCHWTARGSGNSERCGDLEGVDKVARATTAISGSWQRKSEGLRGERSASNNQSPGRTWNKRGRAGDGYSVCTDLNAPAKDQRPKFVRWGGSGADRPESGQVMTVGGAAESMR